MVLLITCAVLGQGLGSVPWVRRMSCKQLETEHFAEFSWIHYYRVWVCCFLRTQWQQGLLFLCQSLWSWYVWHHPIILLSASVFCPIFPLFSAYFLSFGHVRVFSINFICFPRFSSLLEHKLSFSRTSSVNMWVLLNRSLISSPQTSWTTVSNCTSAHHNCQKRHSKGNKLPLNMPSMTPNTCDVTPQPQDLLLFCFDFSPATGIGLETSQEWLFNGSNTRQIVWALESCDLILPWPVWESKDLTWHRPRQKEDIMWWFHKRNWAFIINLGTARWTAKV